MLLYTQLIIYINIYIYEMVCTLGLTVRDSERTDGRRREHFSLEREDSSRLEKNVVGHEKGSFFVAGFCDCKFFVICNYFRISAAACSRGHVAICLLTPFSSLFHHLSLYYIPFN